MATVSVGVFPIVPYVQGESIADLYDETALQWLFSHNERRSLVRYWRDVTAGLVDIQATVHPFIMVEGASWVNRLAVGGGQRSSGAAAAVELLQETGVEIDHYAGLVFFILRGQAVDAGATAAGVNGRLVPVNYFDSRAPHSFHAHELGHLIGLDHSFDTSLTTVNMNGEYGDRTDIMSALTFGNRVATFSIPAQEQGDFASNGAFWTMAGPGVSPATMWRYTPGFPAPQPWVHVLPANAAPTSIHLNRAGTPGVQLIAMPTAGGSQWHTVEYRPPNGWDQAFTQHAGANMVAAGVVIHQIRDVGTPADGAGWPKPQQVCYEATIPVPATGDLDWENGSLGVRVVRHTTMDVEVIVGATLPFQQTLVLSVEHEEIFESVTPGPPIQVSRVGSDCGTGTYVSNRMSERAEVRVVAESSGFTNPTFRFEVNGAQLGGWTAVGQVATGNAPVPIDVAVPVTSSETVRTSRTITIPFTTHGNEIRLTVPGGDGTFSCTVTAFVAENPPSSATGEATAQQTIDLTTLELVLPGDAIEDMGACIRRIAEETRVIPRWERRREHPEWGTIILDNIWERTPLQELGREIVTLVELERTHPGVAAPELERAATGLGLQVSDLREIVTSLESMLAQP